MHMLTRRVGPMRQDAIAATLLGLANRGTGPLADEPAAEVRASTLHAKPTKPTHLHHPPEDLPPVKLEKSLLLGVERPNLRRPIRIDTKLHQARLVCAF